MIPLSGAECIYLLQGFSALPVFLHSWTSVIVLKPWQVAIICLAFGAYVIEPIFAGCGDRENNCNLPWNYTESAPAMFMNTYIYDRARLLRVKEALARLFARHFVVYIILKPYLLLTNYIIYMYNNKQQTLMGGTYNLNRTHKVGSTRHHIPTFHRNCYRKQANNTNTKRKKYHSFDVCPPHVEFSWKSLRPRDKTSTLVTVMWLWSLYSSL